MSIVIPPTIGSATTAPTAPDGLNFKALYERALTKARCSITDADCILFAKDVVNDLYELICTTVPDAPWMRKIARLTTLIRST